MSKSVRKFQGYPIYDAEIAFPLPILQVDADTANEELETAGINSPERFKNCVLAQACTRVFGDLMHVRIMRQYAYVSIPGEKKARRYSLGKEARQVVEAFDRGEQLAPNTIVMLNPPRSAKRMKNMRKYAAEWRAKNPEYYSRKRKTARCQTSSDPKNGIVRNGHYVKL